MSLHKMCVEVRPNLCCANVFLQFDHSVTGAELLQISVDAEAVRLREHPAETRASVKDYFSIAVNSLSNLTVEDHNISFRLSVGNIQLATDPELPERALCRATPKPRLEEHQMASLLCGNCENGLCASQEFRRIREFPSGSIDVGEFFCHHGPNFGDRLVPQATDFFYGFQFVVLNMPLLQPSLHVKGTHLYCRRCLQYLGETLFEGRAAKLWSDTLRLRSSDQFVDIFESAFGSSSYQLLSKIVRESELPAAEPLLQQMPFHKVLLEASFPDRKCKYLLLHILEKNLKVLRNAQPLGRGHHAHKDAVRAVPLELNKCFKLLYRPMCESGHDDDDDDDDDEEADRDGGGDVAEHNSVRHKAPPLLLFWQQDTNVHSLKVSPSTFSNLLRELQENALLLPRAYRRTKDDFELSYVFYKDQL